MRALVFCILCCAGPSLAHAVEHRYVRIFHSESDQYSVTSNIAFAGYAYLPDHESTENFTIRARLYRPIAGELKIERELTLKARPDAVDEGVYQFGATFKQPNAWLPGTYILRVDCLDKTAKQKLIARQSVFVRTVAPPGKQATVQSESRNRNLAEVAETSGE